MKKMICVVAIVVFILATLASCSATTAAESPAASSAAASSAGAATAAAPASSAPATSAATETVKAAFLAQAMSNPSNAFIAKMFEKHAAEFGFEMTVMDGKADPAVDAQNVQTAIAQGVKVIFIKPNDCNAIVPSLMAAKNAGVIVCMFGSELAQADQQYRDFFVGANDDQAGELVAQMFIEQFPDGANIVEIGGQAGDDAAVRRHDGFTKGIAGSKINVIDFQNTKAWDTNNAMNIMQDFIVKNEGEIQGVFCHWDGGMTGIIQAELAAKIDPASLYQIGIDGNKAGFDQVKAEQQNVSCMQNFETMAKNAMQLANDKIGGKTIEAVNYAQWDIVTKDTINNFTYPEW